MQRGVFRGLRRFNRVIEGQRGVQHFQVWLNLRVDFQVTRVSSISSVYCWRDIGFGYPIFLLLNFNLSFVLNHGHAPEAVENLNRLG